MSSTQQLQHLYWRAGFGPRPQDVAAGLSMRKALRQLLRDAEAYEPLAAPDLTHTEPQGVVMSEPAPGYQPVPDGAATTLPDQPLTPMRPRSALRGGSLAAGVPRLRRAPLTPEQRRMQNVGIREAYVSMSTDWMNRMATSPAQLREKMTLFWHGHFACRVRQPAAALSLHNTTRKHALGKFADLLLAVSQEPAMLQFLNNQQNRKAQPNENFAREVMELFTLGRGHYTEQDVKEAARAFTGWGYDAQGNFKFRERDHDAGPKTFLGRTGNLTGEDVLQHILQQPAAATFLVTKVYCFFVNEVPNPAHIEALAGAFRQSGYDIAALVERLFSADWFYEPANLGTHIKSPVELLAGLRRTLNLQFDNDKPLLGYQKALGQTLFQPPNVAGWPGGRNWIDSSSLLLRLQLPAVLFRNAEFAVALKQDENDIAPNLTKTERTVRPGTGTHLPLAPLQQLLGATPAAQHPEKLSAFLLQTPIRPENLHLVQQAALNKEPAEALRTTLISLLSLPEYQLS
ncbi:DUF1800 domain-containing protein [Hymenobacter arizonensis]|uniref:Uncharacterized conserved protein, DUF1800 family n=1 Tax=Hymenobacter arizonensis TaxID=1227077 RepID=A0A1I5WW74_HYMAR|nr:DUF1800 domain-containing protein [Hymenobacter arizonensis]SFQ23954.1 Uncharacterized conserved protein, DUF1800 family [Hymenobacter arizonensis]